MSRRRRLVLILWFVLVPFAARAQGPWTTYIRPTTCNDIIALGDTVWMATGEAGLLRYFRGTGTWNAITREPSGLAGNDVRAITFDRSGNLFAAVPGKGVSRLDTDGRWSLLNAFDGLPSDTVLALAAQGDTVWIGTTRGLALYNGKVVAGSIPDLGTASPFVDDHINGIEITGDTLFVSNPKGVHIARLSQRPLTWTLIDVGLLIDGGSNVRNVRGLASDGHNVLTLMSGANPSNPAQGLFSSFRWFTPLSRWISDFPANSQVRRLRDDFGTVLATTPSGVYRRSFAGVWTLIPGSPVTDNSDSPALEVGTDASGRTFASTAGVLLEEGSPNWSRHVPPGPPGNDCRNVASVGNVLYACFEGKGVGRLRGDVWRTYPAGVVCSLPACDPDTTFLSASFPKVLLLDPLGPKWIGMWDGPLVRFDDTVSPPRFKNIVYASTDPDSAHLHSTTHGYAADLNHQTPGKQPGRWFGLDSDRIGSTPGDPLGLDVYDTSGTFIRNYNTSYPRLKNGLIRALAVDRINQMWVGYKSVGLSTFAVPDSLHTPITLDEVPGSAALDIFGLAIQGDSVWVLASDGLHRFRQSRRSLVTTLSIAAPPALFSVHPVDVGPDGSVYVGTTGGLRVHQRGRAAVDYNADNSPLADNEVRSVFVDPSGVVWLATAGGINRFDPKYVPPPPPRLPSLHVTMYPNPAWLTGIGFELRLKGQATAYDGEVYDLNGRMVHRFHAGGNGVVVWNGRDLDQRRVDPGMYFLRVRGGGAEATSRVVVLR